MKYAIVVDNNGQESPLLFPECINHNTVCNRNGPVISGGFCDLTTKGWIVYGKSITLHKDSRPEDAEILNRVFLEKVS
jgi:hypothetical protein